MMDDSLQSETTDSTAQASASSSSGLSQLLFTGRSRWLIGLSSIGLLLTVATPMLQMQLAAQESETSRTNSINLLRVETLTVKGVDRYSVSRSYTGEIAAPRSSDLGFTRGGELVKVLVEEGDRVTVGQPLARLDIQSLLIQRQQLKTQKAEAQARLLELQRGARQEDIAAAQAEVRDVENQLRLQEQQRSRREYLLAEGAISREQLDEVAFGAEALDARLNRARSHLQKLLNGTRPEQIAAQQAVVQQFVAGIADLNVSLNKSTLLASFDGIVAGRLVDEGVVVSAGQTVIRLVESKAPEARIGMPEDAVSRLNPGTPVTVTVGAKRYRARVKFFLPETHPNTRTRMVVFQLEQAALFQANPGQTARVEFSETMTTDGMWVPTQALTQDIRGLWSVYVLSPTSTGRQGSKTTFEVQPKSVEILHQESDRALVRGTLRAGDRIIANGTHRLVPGQPVQPVN